MPAGMRASPPGKAAPRTGAGADRSGGMLEAMANRSFFRTGMALVALCAALPALADTQFRVRKMTRDDVPLGKGQCDIRLQVDNEVEVSVRRDMVNLHTIAGRPPRDDGSECNAPLPDRDIQGFQFQVTGSRNEIAMLAEPSRRNGFAAVVRIRDSSGGEGGYSFRLTWQMTGGDDFSRQGGGPPPGGGRGGPGFSWNNVIHFNGAGRGSSVLTAYGSQRLSAVTVDIDRGGKIVVSFRGETERPLLFTGTVMGREGAQYKADVVTEDGRLHGPLYITIGSRDEITAIRFEGTDGFGQLRVNWDQR
jgi:hypothetical protein